MQLYAQREDGVVVSAKSAERQTDYCCLECRGKVRVRSGAARRAHFFHLDPTPSCRQHQKGEIHLQLQYYFHAQLPEGDCALEHPFPEIGRIADVAWLSKKIVFEIQYSPISPEEVLARGRDYKSAGWQVVWILHDERFNQGRLTFAERVLSASPHYFTNFDDQGRGIIYDQFEKCSYEARLCRLPPLAIDVANVHEIQRDKKSVLQHLKRRAIHWPFYFSGDLMSQLNFQEENSYLEKALTLEKELSRSPKKSWKAKLCALKQMVLHPFRILFCHLLERVCR